MLKLNISQEISLTDTDALNNTNYEVLGTGFDDSNALEITELPLYTSGRIDPFMKLESFTLEPGQTGRPFYIYYIMIESLLAIDIEFFQPAYVRDTISIPASSYTMTNVSRTIMQFGLFNKLVLTSAWDNNKVKYLLLGAKTINVD